MEFIHLSHNRKTRCGFNPFGVKTTSTIIETTCWDCLNAYFHDYDIVSETEIHEKDKIIRVKVNLMGETLASLKYCLSGSFIPIVMDVWVRPDSRNRGLATIAMKKIMQIAGPPIQLKSEPYSVSQDEPVGLSDSDLRTFYTKLGFVGLTNSKTMVWYPTVKKSTLSQIKVEPSGNYYEASVVGSPEIRGSGTSYDSAIGNLIFSHKEFFGIEFIRSNVEESANEEQEERT